MKSITLCLLGLMIAFTGVSQGMDTIQSTRVSQYVFPEFVKGKVKQKNGHVEEAMLNYNSSTQEMVFVQNGNFLALAELENIDTVYLEGSRFFPVKKMFYEVGTKTPVPLLINHRCKVIPPTKNAGFGSTSQAGSIDNISSISNNVTYLLKLPDDYKIIPEIEFALKKDNEYLRIINVKQFTKVFPNKADAIQDFVKKNNTNFKNREDMISLTIFCNQS